VEFIDGIDFARSPRLLGFVKAEAKEGSETILRVDVDKPLLVRWRYGLGRAIAFMSDARSRWAAPWVRWASFGRCGRKWCGTLLTATAPCAPAFARELAKAKRSCITTCLGMRATQRRHSALPDLRTFS